MRKRLVSVMMCTVMATMLFAGCGGNSSKSTTADNVQGTEQTGGSDELTTDEITLKVWESSGQTEEFIKQAGEAFTKLHPNITNE